MLKRWRPPCCGIQTGPQPQRWVTFNSKNTTRPGCWKEKQNGMSQVPIKSRKVHWTTTLKCSFLKKISRSLPMVLWLTTFEWIGNLPLIRPNVETLRLLQKMNDIHLHSKSIYPSKANQQSHGVIYFFPPHSRSRNISKFTDSLKKCHVAHHSPQMRFGPYKPIH